MLQLLIKFLFILFIIDRNDQVISQTTLAISVVDKRIQVMLLIVILCMYIIVSHV